MSAAEMAVDKLHPRRPIMIVDDEEPILLAIDTTLRMAGISNIITCGDSRRVLGLLSEESIEVMLLDLNMPHLHGKRLLEAVKSDHPDIPNAAIMIAISIMPYCLFIQFTVMHQKT